MFAVQGYPLSLETLIPSQVQHLARSDILSTTPYILMLLFYRPILFWYNESRI